MNILQLLACASSPGGGIDYCAGAPTLNSVTIQSNVLNNCPTGWVTSWLVSITGSLTEYQEYYWEIADNMAGDNWAFHSRGTSPTLTVSQSLIGADGGGLDTIEYMRVRCYIVPTWASDATDACSGPVTSSQAEQSANLC